MNLTAVVGESEDLSDIAEMTVIDFDTSRINEFDAVTVSGDPGNIGIIYKTSASVGLLAHEAVHIKNKIFSHVSLMLDTDNDEAEAYLMGWIVDILWNHKLKFEKQKS
jgi:hypothetical protein